MARYRLVHDPGYLNYFKLQKLVFGFWWRTVKTDNKASCDLYVQQAQNPIVKEYS